MNNYKGKQLEFETEQLFELCNSVSSVGMQLTCHIKF